MTQPATHIATVDAPGFYILDETVYHSDQAVAPEFGPSLSSTGAKALLDAPARYRYEQEHREHKKVCDVGHAVPAEALGVGLDLAVIPAEHLAADGAASTKAAREFIAEARLDGRVPLKAAEALEIRTIAANILAHPDARAIFSEGDPEISIYAKDPATGTTMRGRIDWLRDNAAIDLKTIGRSARPDAFARQAADMGYDVQWGWYRTILRELGRAEDFPFIHVVAETKPPYLVSVVRFGPEDMEVGNRRARQALDIYARCVETGEWPGYETAGIAPASLPSYHRNRHLDQ